MPPKSEQRTHQRVTIETDVTCTLEGGEPFAARAKDICLGGMFIESEAAVEFGANLTISILLPNSRKPLSLPGVVRWHRPGGFGVQFGLLGARETHTLVSFVG